MVLGDRLRAILLQKNLSQGDVGRSIGLLRFTFPALKTATLCPL